MILVVVSDLQELINMERPEEGCTDKQFSKWFWSDFNETCKLCKNTCKQSHVVRLTACPNSVKIGD